VSTIGLVSALSFGTATNINGCKATATVNVNANPTANAGQDITICVGGNLTIVALTPPLVSPSK